MKLDQNPFFRKVPIPWHDTDLFCILITLLMATVFAFSKIGLRLASESDDYHAYGWVPMLLMVLSSIVLASNTIRILTRMIKRRPEEDE